MRLETITFTGADDRTSIKALADISSSHPKVEWGILTSDRALQALSFPLLPGLGWIDRFLEVPAKRCLHLCGGLCRRFIAGDEKVIAALGAERLRRFDRLQLNFHDSDEQHLDADRLFATLERHGLNLVELIIPVGQENIAALSRMLNAGLNVTVLFDDSRGAGLRPASWPVPLSNAKCGYAGGLGPDNIRAELAKISLILPSLYETWVDMEGRIREGPEFSLSKVATCITESEGFL